MINKLSIKSSIIPPKKRGARMSTKSNVGFNVIQNIKHKLSSIEVKKVRIVQNRIGLNGITILRAQETRPKIIFSTKTLPKLSIKSRREVIKRDNTKTIMKS